MVNAEVSKNGNENNASLMRRFSRKSQSSGVVKRVRSIRYHSRDLSDAGKKKNALNKISRKDRYQELFKLGRISAEKKRRR